MDVSSKFYDLVFPFSHFMTLYMYVLWNFFEAHVFSEPNCFETENDHQVSQLCAPGLKPLRIFGLQFI